MIPVRDCILAEEIEETVSKGGILIPATVDPTGGDRLATRKLRVLAVGPGTVHVTDKGEKLRVTVSDMLGTKIEKGSIIVTTRYIQLFKTGDHARLRLLTANDVSAVLSEGEL